MTSFPSPSTPFYESLTSFFFALLLCSLFLITCFVLSHFLLLLQFLRQIAFSLLLTFSGLVFCSRFVLCYCYVFCSYYILCLFLFILFPTFTSHVSRPCHMRVVYSLILLLWVDNDIIVFVYVTYLFMFMFLVFVVYLLVYKYQLMWLLPALCLRRGREELITRYIQVTSWWGTFNML